ncbi:hypothetical protein Q670_16275 [Alcanivorax sp. P2S70]|uniref:hypothetical protein n=1 Tax=Alcanivorax sp. P2S70 TaxID=1397527 RepID=UPI0003B49014|nr:hypothetical protein [Alcanivorax sp. P2S70]ERP88048.1 hypothetical protein Q670_16275 [Alcanivorax sp. P2S70]
MNRSLAYVAKEKLGRELPEILRNELNSVFRVRKDKKSDPALNKWLGLVLKERVGSKRKDVQAEYEASVSNALVLIYLLGSGVKSQTLITGKYALSRSPSRPLSSLVNDSVDAIRESSKERCFEFAVLGVVPEKHEQIVERLLYEDFDILKDHLPSPFEGEGLSVIAAHYDQSIPWFEYREVYDLAEESFRDGDLLRCISSLEQLIKESIVRIPVAERLLVQAHDRRTEHEELRGVLGKI